MFDEALELKTYVEVTQPIQVEEEDGTIEDATELLHSGEITCRELRQGKFLYHIKPRRGKALWFTHGEIDGTEKIDMSVVEERSVVEPKKR